MRNYIIKRIAQSVLILFCVMFIIYALIRSLPSSFAETMAMQLAQAPGAKPYEEWLAQLNAAYGLDLDIIPGFFSWLSKAVVGNFGDSWKWNVPATQKFTEVIGLSVIMGGISFVLSLIIVVMVVYEPSSVLSVKVRSAAEAAGLKEGDVITSYQGYHVDLGKDIYVYSYMNELKEGDTVRLTLKRDGEKKEISYQSDTNVRYLLGCNFKGDDTTAMTVESVMEGMPLDDAGVKEGDVITSINGVKIVNAQDYQDYIKENPLTGDPVELTYTRDGLEYHASITPKEYRTADSGFTYNIYC